MTFKNSGYFARYTLDNFIQLCQLKRDGASDGQVLTWSTALGCWTPGNGSGTISGSVIGPVSGSTDHALVRWDGTTGLLVQNSNAILTDAGDLSLVGYVSASDAYFSGNVAVKDHSGFPCSEFYTVTRATLTTSSNPTSIFTINLKEDYVYWFDAKIVGREHAVDGENAVYMRQVKAYRLLGSGSASFGKKGVNSTFTDKSTKALNSTFETSGSYVNLIVEGISAISMSWACTIQYQAISLPS